MRGSRRVEAAVRCGAAWCCAALRRAARRCPPLPRAPPSLAHACRPVFFVALLQAEMRAHSSSIPECARMAALAEEGGAPHPEGEEQSEDEVEEVVDDDSDPYEFPADDDEDDPYE